MKAEHVFHIADATREGAPFTVSISGEGGSGKTLSALKMARGFAGPDGKIGIIDTEGKRALIYAERDDIGTFRHLDFQPPYSSERFKAALQAMVADGCRSVVIDSASHEHEAEGGMLHYAEVEASRIGGGRGVDLRKWIKPKIEHNRFMRYAVACPAYVIFCLRQHHTSEVVEDDRGKKEIRPIVKTVCEKNFQFDMMISIQLETDTHRASYLKVPEPFQPFIPEGEMITIEGAAGIVQELEHFDAQDEAVAEWVSTIRDWAPLGTEELKRRLDEFKEHAPDGTVANIKRKYPTLFDEVLQTARNADEENALVASQEAAESDEMPPPRDDHQIPIDAPAGSQEAPGYE